MASAHTRRKQPEAVRRALIESAATLAAEGGIVAVTVQAVSEAAGVTKGGLFHHFASKQALVTGVFGELLARFDAEIDAWLAAEDAQAYGRFTRAYVHGCFGAGAMARASPWTAAIRAMLADPALGARWQAWLQARLARHAATDGAFMLQVVRLAADGAWYAAMVEGADAAGDEVRDGLIALTAPDG